jgi:hypothetical protein
LELDLSARDVKEKEERQHREEEDARRAQQMLVGNFGFNRVQQLGGFGRPIRREPMMPPVIRLSVQAQNQLRDAIKKGVELKAEIERVLKNEKQRNWDELEKELHEQIKKLSEGQIRGEIRQARARRIQIDPDDLKLIQKHQIMLGELSETLNERLMEKRLGIKNPSQEVMNAIHAVSEDALSPRAAFFRLKTVLEALPKEKIIELFNKQPLKSDREEINYFYTAAVEAFVGKKVSRKVVPGVVRDLKYLADQIHEMNEFELKTFNLIKKDIEQVTGEPLLDKDLKYLSELDIRQEWTYDFLSLTAKVLRETTDEQADRIIRQLKKINSQRGEEAEKIRKSGDWKKHEIQEQIH